MKAQPPGSPKPYKVKELPPTHVIERYYRLIDGKLHRIAIENESDRHSRLGPVTTHRVFIDGERYMTSRIAAKLMGTTPGEKHNVTVNDRGEYVVLPMNVAAYVNRHRRGSANIVKRDTGVYEAYIKTPDGEYRRKASTDHEKLRRWLYRHKRKWFPILRHYGFDSVVEAEMKTHTHKER